MQPLPTEPLRLIALRATIAIGVAGALCALGAAHVGHRLAVQTTIVGYPIYADFDVNRYQDLFYLAAVVFPLLALGLYHLIAWRGPLRRRVAPRHRLLPVEKSEHASLVALPAAGALCAALARVLLVGAVIAIEASAAIVPSTARGGDVAVGALAYLALVLAIAATWPGQPGRGLALRISAVNGLGALVPLPLLGAVSGVTAMVVGGKSTVAYPWFPLWLAAAAAVASVATWVIARRHFHVRVAVIERRLVLYVVGALAVFLVLAGVPGPLGPMDTFTEGEYLAGAWLILHGAVPWRDLYMIHGLLDDGLKAMVGFAVFGTSRWGATAGITMFVTPAYFVGTYLFVAYTFARRWAMVVAFAIAITCGIFVDWDARYLLWPLVLMAFVAVLRKASAVRAGVLALALVAQAVLVPEMSLAIIAVGLALVAFELYERPRGRFAPSQLARSGWTAVSGIALCAAFAVYLAATGALGGFIGYFEDFASSHSLTGGIPLWTNYAIAPTPDDLGISRFVTTYPGLVSRPMLELVLPTIAVLATVLLVAARVRGGQRLATEDWVAVAGALLVVLYEQKALSRADDAHIVEVFAVATPLLMVLAYRAVILLEGVLGRALAAVARRRANARPGKGRAALLGVPGVSLVVLCLVAGLAPRGALSLLGDAPGHFRPTSPSPAPPPYAPGLPSLGYATPGALPPGLVDDLGALFARYDPGNGPVFDLSDSPGVVEFLLGREQGSRFYDVSLAITPEAQDQLVDDLRQSKPRLVLWNGITGLPSWDFIENEVRQYVVARYVLDHYRPLALVDHELVLIADTSPAPAMKNHEFSDLYFSQSACAWGDSPNFLAATPLSRPVDLPVRRVGPIRGGTLYAVHLPAGASEDDGFVTVTRRGAGAAEVILTNPVEGGRRNILRHDISWVDQPGTLHTEVEVGSCLQWHGYGQTLDLRYLGSGSISSVTLGA